MKAFCPVPRVVFLIVCLMMCVCTLGSSQTFNMSIEQKPISKWVPCYISNCEGGSPGGSGTPNSVLIRKTSGSRTTFSFTLSSMGLSASGTFTASLVSGKEYVVTSISGTQNGSSMTLLSPGTYAGNDNYVFSSGAALDSAGRAFASNGVDYNIWFNKGTYCSWSDFNSCTPIAFNLILPAANSLELSVTGPANTNFLAIN